MKMKNPKEENYMRQNYVGSIRETVRILIERLRSLVQPSNALTEILMGKPISIYQISECGLTGLTLSDVAMASS